MHLTTEAGDPVAPALFEEDTLVGLAPNVVLPEPLPDEDDSGDDPLRTYLREIHEVNLLTAFLAAAVVSLFTKTIEALPIVSAPLLVATRLVATDLFHALGSPEVRQIDPNGALPVGWWPGEQREIRAWAEQHGIPVA